MERNRSRSRGRSRSRIGIPARRKRYDEPHDRDRGRDRSSPAPTGLLVRNISLSARPEDLRVPFERFGPVKDVYLPKNYYTGEPRGFGFVKYRYPEDAADAKSHLDRTVIGGREIRIVFAEENRKTPLEMRRVTHPSSRGSHRRRTPSYSPGHRRHSYSRSPSPAKHNSRFHEARGDYYSPRRSRSVPRSVSPRGGRPYRSHERPPRHSKSRSRSPSILPNDAKTRVPNHHSYSPRGNVDTAKMRSRSPAMTHS